MTRQTPKNYYKILDISTTATDKEIKSAYRSLARKFHPDVNPGDKACELKFKEVTEAYNILMDETQRRIHDTALGMYENAQNQKTTAKNQKTRDSYSARRAYAKAKQPKSTSEKDYKKDGFGKSFSTFFEGIMKSVDEEINKQQQFKSQPNFSTDPPPTQDEPDKEKATANAEQRNTQTKQKKAINGKDITVSLHLTSDEARKGVIKKVNIVHSNPCEKCNGTGKINQQRCKTCQGKGEHTSHKKLDVKIKAGVKHGSRIRIVEEGNRGLHGGLNGDLYLYLKVYNPDQFEYDVSNVYSEVKVSPHEAVIGSEIEVLTVDGFVKMMVPAGTQVGQKFRLARQGLPDKNGERGDHYVKINIEVPKKLSAKEKELYEQIARVTKFNPREYKS
jgi:DnaJ-class molecular chaperone